MLYARKRPAPCSHALAHKEAQPGTAKSTRYHRIAWTGASSRATNTAGISHHPAAVMRTPRKTDAAWLVVHTRSRVALPEAENRRRPLAGRTSPRTAAHWPRR